MSNVQISSEDVLQYANQLTSMEKQVESIFEEIKSKMNYIESIWSSMASRNLIIQFRSMYPVFTSYVNALNNYALFLNDTASAYSENERLLTASISNE